MTYSFETKYDQKSVKAMAKALRKTVRRKRSRRSHRLGWLVILLALLLVISAEAFTLRTLVTIAAGGAVLAALLFEDSINGFFARRKLLPGTEFVKTAFSEDGYCSSTAVGETTFRYDAIRAMAETKAYYVLIFSGSHAQVYEKHTLTGGSQEEFVRFLTEKTGITMETV